MVITVSGNDSAYKRLLMWIACTAKSREICFDTVCIGSNELHALRIVQTRHFSSAKCDETESIEPNVIIDMHTVIVIVRPGFDAFPLCIST